MKPNILRAWRLNKITGKRRWDPDHDIVAELTREFERKGGKIQRLEHKETVRLTGALPTKHHMEPSAQFDEFAMSGYAGLSHTIVGVNNGRE